ncbi:MAG: sulfotransferase domain-containing protein [Candidatus Thermoplasmatota archaeon]|nr:sulfotransferase domain-containing protein [Candidatus Thermoplasmatota archaeon]
MYFPGLWTVKQIVLDLRRALGSKPAEQVFLVTYHKVATVLIRKVMMEVTEKIGWRYSSTMGVAENIPRKTDVLHVVHGTGTDELFRSGNKGIRIIRDPRDVIVSGYLYHQRCSEKWCINSDFSDPAHPFPQVPWPLDGVDLATKEKYVASLDGLSYQEKIRSLSKEDGLIFEMDGFAKITIDEMISWKDNDNVLTIKMEDLVGDFDGQFEKMFRWVGIDNRDIANCLEVAIAHDMNRMGDDQIASNPHISTGKLRKWEEFFTPDVSRAYQERFVDAHTKLGYL